MVKRLPYVEQVHEGPSSDSTMSTDTNYSISKRFDDIISEANVSPPSNQSIPSADGENKGRYSLNQVKKIDVYSRRIFPSIYGLFVLYFFIRYHAIEGAMSIGQGSEAVE